MTIRLLTVSDVAPFRELFLRSLKEEPSAFLHDDRDASLWSIERLEKFVKNGWMVGAFDGDQLLGFAGLSRYQGRKIQHKGNIGPVYVAPEARGRKLAAGMMIILEEIAKGEGIERLMLSTDVTNAITQHLYKRLGYIAWGVEKHILKLADGSYVDDVVMVKLLI